MDKIKDDKKVKDLRLGKNIKIKKYDDIFDDSNIKPHGSISKGAEILVNTNELRDFKNHPFKIDGRSMDELKESIEEHGILSPIIVRHIKDEIGGYEIISGHRRKHCALELGILSVPVIIKDIGDDEAVLAMVDSNIQREDILPSEKAFAYKMKLEAIKRQGKRTDLTSGQVGQKLQSVSASDKIGEEYNESGRQIRRYIRLTEIPEIFLNAIDNKKMSVNAGVLLSYLKNDEKKIVEIVSNETHKLPSLRQAGKLRELSDGENEFNIETVIDILLETKNKNTNVNIRTDLEKADLTLSPLKKTWFIDLDGTILKHDGYINGGDELLPGAYEFMTKAYETGLVIITTAREEYHKKITEEALKRFKIPYHDIIYGVPMGERIVVNDRKPSGLPTAFGINIDRNKGVDFKIIIDEDL